MSLSEATTAEGTVVKIVVWDRLSHVQVVTIYSLIYTCACLSKTLWRSPTLRPTRGPEPRLSPTKALQPRRIATCRVPRKSRLDAQSAPFDSVKFLDDHSPTVTLAVRAGVCRDQPRRNCRFPRLIGAQILILRLILLVRYSQLLWLG